MLECKRFSAQSLLKGFSNKLEENRKTRTLDNFLQNVTKNGSSE